MSDQKTKFKVKKIMPIKRPNFFVEEEFKKFNNPYKDCNSRYVKNSSSLTHSNYLPTVTLTRRYRENTINITEIYNIMQLYNYLTSFLCGSII